MCFCRYSFEIPSQASEWEWEELLQWFAQSASECPEPVMVLPPSLSKGDRAMLHKMGERLGLASESQGVGAARHLTIRATPPTPAVRQRVHGTGTADELTDDTQGIQSGDGSSQQRRQQRQQASKHGLFEGSYMGLSVHEIWVALQEEGGHLGEFSKGEVAEMIAQEQQQQQQQQQDQQPAPSFGLTPATKSVLDRR
ncbi:hypothetical protein DUNSADRAFT_3064 [Dunaliella salina]|uniref:R3H domain-containing protein n=1 Tax=Dunaliella salina TaxID=3046 RepID=A0ABQ7FVT0_DUNSA|nr:hypothetical protein DUNSADRAFT_3064 [Dunaliella salina]|eukprot:KAF5826448.1 hypothetical protein DUNSADRAFT_3064 [Dunaliella salina]